MKSFGQYLSERQQDVDNIMSALNKINQTDIQGNKRFKSAIEVVNWLQSDLGIMIEKLPGQGTFSIAFKGTEGQEYVMKVSQRKKSEWHDDFFYEFAFLVHKQKLWEHNTLAPKIIYIQTFPDDTGLCIMEHFTFKMDMDHNFTEYLKEIWYLNRENNVRNLARMKDSSRILEQKYKFTFEECLAYFKWLYQYFPNAMIDVHGKNRGYRPNGQLVLFDPVISGRHSLGGNQ